LWGIQGYKPPTNGIQTSTPKYCIPKAKGTFVDALIKTGIKGPPGPGNYDMRLKWDHCPLGTMKGPNKTTYLDQVQKVEKVKPGPSDYSPEKTSKRPLQGKLDKDERMSFLGDIEYIASGIPAANI
jgi:hypothetical protein